MGVSVFIYGPLVALGVLALLSVLGLGAGGGAWGDITFNAHDAANDAAIYYDGGGNPLCYGNLSYIPPTSSGRIIDVEGVSGVAFWNNGSGTYPMYSDAFAAHPLLLVDTGTTLGGRDVAGVGGFTVSIGTTLGILAIISGLCAVGVIASVKIFGFGLSDVGINTLMKGAAYILMWAIFSGLAMNLIVYAADLYTPIIYLALTGAYALGVLGDIGTPSQS